MLTSLEAHTKKPDDLHFLVWLALKEFSDVDLPHPECKFFHAFCGCALHPICLFLSYC